MKKPSSSKNQSKEQKVIPLKDCLAKTQMDLKGNKIRGANVMNHCITVGRVAEELISRKPEWLQKELFPEGSQLIAAAHDLGKVSPHFQEKLYKAIHHVLGVGNAESDSSLGYHFTVSQNCLVGAPRFIPEILGRHHGTSPASNGLPNDEKYGGAKWQAMRMELLEGLKKGLGADWPKVNGEIHASVLSGLTSVADWIGSSSTFDLIQENDEIRKMSFQEKINYALDQSGFVPTKIKINLSFSDVFGFTPHDAQVKFYEIVKKPGVFILEAPMGLGKTEAALYAAYKLMASNLATGVYFALPTQLTSNKIHERMEEFLVKVLDDNCEFKSLLLHSNAWLKDTEMGEEGMPGKSWFSNSKRGLLAPFAVGTIDQALMSVMNVKHGFVRAFGLAGKVVILDEVHSYDSYTGTIMKKLVSALQEMHCTVIILSATLTAERKSELLGVMSSEDAYPLVTAKPKNEEVSVVEVTALETARIQTHICHDVADAIEEVLLRVERGEHVLWIENTVKDSQSIYRVIAGRLRAGGIPADCGLIHSRFLQRTREEKETHWVNLYGKNGHAKRKGRGRILVGTQVLEQSLDIDADFLVTRICPTDMLFQRMGRLWRHRSADKLRPKEAKREAWFLAPSLDEALVSKEVWGGSGYVYAPYVLYRSLELWANKKEVILPDEIRSMLEATYVDRQENGLLAEVKQDILQSIDKLHGLALLSVSKAGKTASDVDASTRYCESDSNEVLLIRKKDSDENNHLITLLNGEVLALPKRAWAQNSKTKRQLSAIIQKNVVKVSGFQSPLTPHKQIQWLKDYVYLGDYGEDSLFRLAIVDEDHLLKAIDLGVSSKKLCLEYTEELGYVANKL